MSNILLDNSKEVVPNSLNDLAAEHVRLYQQLRDNRGNWEVQWNDTAKIVSPNDLNSFQGTRIVEGDKRTQYLYDNTANTALTRFVAILDSLLTPHSSKWHTITTDDPVLNKIKSVREYFELATNVLFRERYRQTANFIEQNQNVYFSLGAYGTGGMFIDSLAGQKGLRYKFMHLGELYHSENHQGIPDKVYRHFRLTARQALNKWPDTCPELIKTMAATLPETPYEFLHCVVPNEGVEPGRKDWRGMPFTSCYVALIGNQMLEIGGYRTFPYAITKYMQTIMEVYGRGPMSDILPTIKTLNEEKKVLLKQSHRVLDPMYLVHDDGVLNTMSAKPGSIIAGGVSADGRPLVHALQTGNIQITKEIMDDDRNAVKDAFFTTLFQILVETPEMTATEVMERAKEKAALIAPSIGRQEMYLSRVIEREIDLCEQQGLLPSPPYELRKALREGIRHIVKYESPLAKMRRADEAAGLMRMVEQSLQIVQATQDPTVMHYFNWDEIMPDMADIGGVPARWMNSLDKVNSMKQAQQQQQQIQNAIQAGPAAAAVLKASKGQ